MGAVEAFEEVGEGGGGCWVAGRCAGCCGGSGGDEKEDEAVPGVFELWLGGSGAVVVVVVGVLETVRGCRRGGALLPDLDIYS